MKFPQLFVLAAVAAGVLAGGCVSEVEKTKLMGGVPPSSSYAKIRDCKLELQLVSSPNLEAGRPAVVTFALKNVGGKPVLIDEWYADEGSNLKVLCQPWFVGDSAPDPRAWLPASEEQPVNALRYPVTLRPGNIMIIAKKLPFVEKLVVRPGTTRRFFIKARLNLTSVDAESRVEALHVRPQEEKNREK